MSNFPVFTLLLLLFLAVPAQAGETAQRWLVLEEGSGLIHQITGTMPQARAQNFSTEIYFDPGALDKSSFLIAFSFTPPGQAAANANTNTLDGYFESASVSRKDKSVFLAKGTLNILGNKQPAVVEINPYFVKNTDPPKMVFDGKFSFQPRAFLSSADAGPYPSELVVQFRFTAEPLP